MFMNQKFLGLDEDRMGPVLVRVAQTPSWLTCLLNPRLVKAGPEIFYPKIIGRSSISLPATARAVQQGPDVP